MREADVRVHRDVPATRMWTYAGSFPGPTFETRSGHGLLVEWANELPDKHILPIDHGVCGAGADVPEVRAVVHVHGARVSPESDGYPEAWYPPGHTALYHYPNRQDAATLWYHDHTMGIERLNQYAGLLGMFLIRDEVEDALRLPSGPHDVPIVLSDRLFDAEGQLVYPTSGDPLAPWVPELEGDALLVNGKLFPYLEVEPRRYRFRVLNASNSRFYNLSLSNGQRFVQLGTDQGLLSAPNPVEVLTVAPAERADVTIDFSQAAGQSIVLHSQNFQLLQFRIGARLAGAKSAPLPTALRPIRGLSPAAAVKTRRLTLNDYEIPKTQAMVMLLNASRWRDPVTEKPILGSVEIWELVNLTDDIHPIHLHLVRFQILERQPFDADTYNSQGGKMIIVGKPVPPDPQEAGWKDTVRAHPGLITRIIVQFEPFAGRYLWHCHLLEHAANEMMRPFEIVTSA
jgi:spore coat protein A